MTAPDRNKKNPIIKGKTDFAGLLTFFTLIVIFFDFVVLIILIVL